MFRKNKTPLTWSSNFAYALGLIATDGNLSPDGRHLHFTSKDKKLVESFRQCLGLQNKISRKGSGSTAGKKYYVVQFGDIALYEFLEGVGITRAKSKTMGALQIPDKYFFDFLRGCVDGDGSISVAIHPESIVPQLKLRLCSANLAFLVWNKEMIRKNSGIESGWIYSDKRSMHTLSYGKADSIKILKKMYYSKVQHYLDRKYKSALPFLE